MTLDFERKREKQKIYETNSFKILKREKKIRNFSSFQILEISQLKSGLRSKIIFLTIKKKTKINL